MGQELGQVKVLRTGSKVFYPKGLKISGKREEFLEGACEYLSSTFKQDVWAIFINPDNNDKSQMHCVSFNFAKTFNGDSQ